MYWFYLSDRFLPCQSLFPTETACFENWVPWLASRSRWLSMTSSGFEAASLVWFFTNSAVQIQLKECFLGRSAAKQRDEIEGGNFLLLIALLLISFGNRRKNAVAGEWGHVTRTGIARKLKHTEARMGINACKILLKGSRVDYGGEMEMIRDEIWKQLF